MIKYRHEQGAHLLQFFGDVQTFAEDRARLDELMDAHWGEVATNKDLLRLDPDYIKYANLVQRNRLVIVTARDDGAIIGYVIALVDTHLHYKTTLMASEDLHYIAPAYRRQGIGSGMIEELQRVLVARGVKMLTMRTKCHSDHGDLLRELGFAPIEVIYGKPLGE